MKLDLESLKKYSAYIQSENQKLRDQYNKLVTESGDGQIIQDPECGDCQTNISKDEEMKKEEQNVEAPVLDRNTPVTETVNQDGLVNNGEDNKETNKENNEAENNKETPVVAPKFEESVNESEIPSLKSLQEFFGDNKEDEKQEPIVGEKDNSMTTNEFFAVTDKLSETEEIKKDIPSVDDILNMQATATEPTTDGATPDASADTTANTEAPLDNGAPDNLDANGNDLAASPDANVNPEGATATEPTTDGATPDASADTTAAEPTDSTTTNDGSDTTTDPAVDGNTSTDATTPDPTADTTPVNPETGATEPTADDATPDATDATKPEDNVQKTNEADGIVGQGELKSGAALVGEEEPVKDADQADTTPTADNPKTDDLEKLIQADIGGSNESVSDGASPAADGEEPSVDNEQPPVDLEDKALQESIDMVSRFVKANRHLFIG